MTRGQFSAVHTHGDGGHALLLARIAAERRFARLLSLGAVRARLRDPKALAVTVRTKRAVSPLYYLPEVDPVTRRNTGLVKTARLAT